jgi:hypothetical protein
MSQIAEGFKDKGLVGSEVTWSTSYEPDENQKAEIERKEKLRKEFQPAAKRLAAEMFAKMGK